MYNITLLYYQNIVYHETMNNSIQNNKPLCGVTADGLLYR